MTDYADYQVNAAPTFMQRAWGRAWNYTLGLAKDAFVASAKMAVKARFGALAPVDALDYLLRDYNLQERYGETESASRSRLARAWASWMAAGTRAGMLTELTAAGYIDPLIEERGNPDRWWDFDVVLRPPFPWDTGDLHAPVIGGGWVIGAETLSHGLPENEEQRVMGLIRKWKPAHAHPRSVFVWLSETGAASFTLADETVITGTFLHWSL